MRLFGMGLILGVTILGMGIMALFVVLRVMFAVLLVQTLRFGEFVTFTSNHGEA